MTELKVKSLRKNSDFQNVYRHGRNYWNRNLILYVIKNDLNYNRVGFSITKKIGNSVERNLIKRRMREIYRTELDLKQGYDMIFIPKKNTVDISFSTLKSAMSHIVGLAKIKRG